VLPNKKGNIVSEKYTSPMKLFEYMASGIPIVASDLPSLKEILDDSNAVFAVPNDPRSFAENIKRVLNDIMLAQRISSKAKQDVLKYSWRERASSIHSFFLEKLSRQN
jgi:glycosyltransferase involved in cell wall biosynthesis